MNLFTGKSIMNMSLPVIIFGADTYLSLYCKSLAYAPIFLEKAAVQTNCLLRMVEVVKFIVGFSVAFLRMEKPFNPILGETYQAYIDGCPVYAEQVSHHPPIASIFFHGRGYKVFGNLESKISMSLKAGVLTNEGVLTIAFDNGEIIRFTLPGGEITGFLIGERTIGVSVGGSQIVDPQNNLYIDLSFGKHKGKT